MELSWMIEYRGSTWIFSAFDWMAWWEFEWLIKIGNKDLGICEVKLTCILRLCTLFLVLSVYKSFLLDSEMCLNSNIIHSRERDQICRLSQLFES